MSIEQTVIVKAARGESFAEVARRVGALGEQAISPDATDAEVLSALTQSLQDLVAAAGYSVVEPVETGTSALNGDGNIVLNGEQTIAGILTVASRVLLGDQTDSTENGVWVTAAGAWARAADFDDGTEVVQGAYVPVLGGDNAGAWVLVTADPITVGVTPQTWRLWRYDSELSILSLLAAPGGADLVSLLSGTSLQTAIDRIWTEAAETIYVRTTGDDVTGDGSIGNPFATPQRAVDALPALLVQPYVIDIGPGTYSTSSRLPAEMSRPALAYVDRVRCAERTAQDGAGLSGSLVFSLDPAAKIAPNATYPRGFYITGAVGSVGILGGEVEGAVGTESLIVAHRGSYVHVRDTVVDGNANSTFGLLAEAGGIMECIDVTATGAVAYDAVTFSGSLVQMAAPGGTAVVGKVSNAGTFSLAIGMECTTNFINRNRLEIAGDAANRCVISGNYDGQGGIVFGAYLDFTNAAASLVARGEIWKIDQLRFDGRLNLQGGMYVLLGSKAFTTGAQSTLANPVKSIPGTLIYRDSTIDWTNSSGVKLGVDRSRQLATVAADGTAIPITVNNGEKQIVVLNNTKGSVATGCKLDLYVQGLGANQKVDENTQIYLINLGNSVELVDSSPYRLFGITNAKLSVGATVGSTPGAVLTWQEYYGSPNGGWFVSGVGARIRATGWTAGTGTPSRGAFAAAAATARSAGYVQAEAQADANRIAALEARLLALETDARTMQMIDG